MTSSHRRQSLTGQGQSNNCNKCRERHKNTYHKDAGNEIFIRVSSKDVQKQTDPDSNNLVIPPTIHKSSSITTNSNKKRTNTKIEQVQLIEVVSESQSSDDAYFSNIEKFFKTNILLPIKQQYQQIKKRDQKVELKVKAKESKDAITNTDFSKYQADQTNFLDNEYVLSLQKGLALALNILSDFNDNENQVQTNQFQNCVQTLSKGPLSPNSQKELSLLIPGILNNIQLQKQLRENIQPSFSKPQESSKQIKANSSVYELKDLRDSIIEQPHQLEQKNENCELQMIAAEPSEQLKRLDNQIVEKVEECLSIKHSLQTEPQKNAQLCNAPLKNNCQTQNDQVAQRGLYFRNSYIKAIKDKGFTGVELIGQGATCIAFKAKVPLNPQQQSLNYQPDSPLNDNVEVVAIKVLQISEKQTSQEQEIMKRIRDGSIANHVFILEPLTHPFGGSFYISNHKCLIYEYCKETLCEHIIRYDLKKERLKELFVQIVLGVSHIHQKGFAHRDLKPQNIFIGRNGIAKIADFGLAISCSSSDYRAVGTYNYAAPEVFNKDREIWQRSYDFKAADCWSLGIILHWMLTQSHPFSLDKLEHKQRTGSTVQPDLSRIADEDASDLISRLLNEDPKKRIQAASVLAHKYLEKECKEIVNLLKVWVQPLDENPKALKSNSKQNQALKSNIQTKNLKPQPSTASNNRTVQKAKQSETINEQNQNQRSSQRNRNATK